MQTIFYAQDIKTKLDPKFMLVKSSEKKLRKDANIYRLWRQIIWLVTRFILLSPGCSRWVLKPGPSSFNLTSKLSTLEEIKYTLLS